jgi:DNA-binding NarL/FixJ family response regulator
VYRPAIERARVLLVVSHPSVAAGLETILRLERRYEVRRTARLADAVELSRAWPAEAALVDAALLGHEVRVELGTPALVLAGGPAEGVAAGRRLDDSRGWVAKDAPSGELISAVERLLTLHVEPAAGSLALFVLGALLLVFAALLLYLAWIALV